MSDHAADSPNVRKAALMWISFIYTQAVRLEDAVDTYTEMEIHRGLIAVYETQGKVAEAKKARRGLRRRKPPPVGADKYFFLLSAAQLVKCVKRLPADGLPTFDDSKLLCLLRNIGEHWEDPNGPSISKVRKFIPDIAPGRLTFTKKDIWFETVSFLEVLQWTRAVELKLRAVETADDYHPLDPSATQSFPQGTRALWATLTGRIK